MARTPKVLEKFTVDIESLDQDGRGVAHRDGKVVFVEGALPGETVTYERFRNKNSYECGRAVSIEKESALRVKPACKHFGLEPGCCGGCAMQHLDPSAQVAIKQRVLLDALWHIGKVKPETMESINLHFTGDFHAITAANNLLAAMIDNARHQGQVDLKTVIWRRVLDVNDRMLRNIVTGLGGPANGIPTETGFDITVASELMAVLCLANDLDDLRARIDRLVVGIKRDGSAYTCKDLGATGALMALLLEAMKPNLVQTLEGNLAFVHGGPFANIAHGCNSVVATKAAMTLGDWAVTEAGFGSDLGAEKFMNIKCRAAGLTPSAIVLVTSTKALKWHGMVPLPEIGKPNVEALKKGLCNLDAHIDNLKHFGPEIVVSLNHFATDTDEEIEVIRARCAEKGVRFAVCDGFIKGGEGAIELAKAVMDAASGENKPLHFTYEADDDVVTKLEKLAVNVYGAKDIELSAAAKKDLKQIQELGFDRLPVCVAKTPYSLSHEPTWLGAPKGFTLPVQRLILNAGAGFVVATTGAIMRMPGLPKQPAALHIDVVNGKIVGLS